MLGYIHKITQKTNFMKPFQYLEKNLTGFKPWVHIAVLCIAFSQVTMAQTAVPAPVRLRGEIVEVNSQALIVKDRAGALLKILVAESVGIQEAYAVSVQSIQPNSFIGTAALAGSDGQLKALEVLVFPEAARGTGEGHYPWDLQPGSTMTNATVNKLDSNASNVEMHLLYKGGEKSVLIPQGVPIVSIRPGTRDLLVTGAQVMIVANKEADHWNAVRVVTGKNGFKPPM